MREKRRLFFFTWLMLLIPLSLGIFISKFFVPHLSLTFAQNPIHSLRATQYIQGQPLARETVDTAKIEKYLTVESALLDASENVSIYFKDEPSEKELSINSVRSWIPASTIKSFVAIEAFRQRDLGLLDFNQAVTIQAQNVVPTELETDDYPRLREGALATIQQLVEDMIVQSDNTAYNTLLDIFDRRNINTTLKNLGITQTVVGEKLNLDNDQFRIDLQVPGRQPNTITAKDLAILFDLLYNNKISSSNEILTIFKRQKINTMIPALLPPNTVVAHKTGDWAPIYHDGGIIYKPDDPFVLAVLTDSNDPSVVAQLARVAYYRNAQVVGQAPEAPKTTSRIENADERRIYLAEAPQETNVLAAQISAGTEERIYTVVPGDTLWSIAQKEYGSGDQYINIVARNDIRNPSAISVGTTLILPAIPGTAFPPAEETLILNARDLGVTENDLRVGKTQTNTIGAAFLLPGSPFYGVKQWFEQWGVNQATTTDAKIDALLDITKAKLGEVKRELASGNMTAVQTSLTGSEDALRQATNLAQTASNNNIALFKIKQLSDLHFAILQEGAANIQNDKKEAYIDAVYAFYEKQKKDVKPAIASAQAANPLQQKPIIGVVLDVKGNLVTLKSDNGKTLQVVLTPLIPARVFDQTSVRPAVSLRQGEKIAVVGQVTAQTLVTPQFILRSLPKDLPIQHRGKVIEIDPKNHLLKLQDTTGKIDTIVIGDQTTIKSRDTNVSLSGIKAGSSVTVVGHVTSTVVNTTPSPATAPTNATPFPTKTPNPESSTFEGHVVKEGAVAPTVSSQQSSVAPQTAANPSPVVESTGATVQATSVVVVNNSSGKNEKIEPTAAPAPKNENKRQERPKSNEKPPQGLPPETKKSEEKKK